MRRRIGFAVALVALVGLPFLADAAIRSLAQGRLRALLEEDLAEALGRSVSVDELELSILPSPHLEARGIRIANPPGHRAPHLLEIGELELGIALRPLLDRELVVDSLEIRDAVLEIETDAEGSFELPFALDELVDDDADEPSDGLALQVRRVAAERLNVFYADGPSGDVRSLRLETLELETEELTGPIHLAVRGSLDETAFELAGRSGPLAELLAPTAPYPVRLTGLVFDARIEAQGTLAAPLALEGLDFSVSATLPDLALTGWPLPDLGPITVSARISDLDGTLGLAGLDLETRRDDPVSADLEGEVDDLAALHGVALRAELQAQNLRFLQRLVETPLPAIDGARLSATLSDQDGSLGLEGELHLEASEGSIRLDLEGGLDDFAQLDEIAVGIRGRAHDLARLAALHPDAPGLPALAPVEFAAQLRDQDGSLGLDDISVRLGRRDDTWVEVSGRVGDLLGQRDVALEVRFGTADIAALARQLGREVPPLGPAEGSAQLTDADGTLGIEKLLLRTGDESGVQIQVSGSFDDLFGLDEVEVDAEIRAADLEVLGELVGTPLPSVGPVEFRGRVHGSDERLEAREMTLRVGESRVQGRFAASFLPGERPTLEAVVVSPLLRLEDLGFGAEETEAEAPVALPALKQALPFDQLRAMELDLDLTVAQITGRAGLDLRDSHAIIRLHDGDLLIGDVGTHYQRGRVRGEFHVDARMPETELALLLDVDGMDLGRLISQVDEDTEAAGLIDLDMDLASQGETPEAIRSALAGEVRLVLRDGTAAADYARRFVVNLADVAFRGLRVPRTPAIGCAVAELEIEDGVATIRSFLLEGGGTTVTGTGRVDLVAGTCDLRLSPTTSRRGIVSITPEVDVTGPLTDPRFRPVKRTLATSLGRGLLGGLRKVGGRLLSPLRSRSDTVEAGQLACAEVGRD